MAGSHGRAGRSKSQKRQRRTRRQQAAVHHRRVQTDRRIDLLGFSKVPESGTNNFMNIIPVDLLPFEYHVDVYTTIFIVKRVQ